MQNDIDKTLKYCLSRAYSDFAIDFRKDDSFYKRAFANINVAALLSGFLLMPYIHLEIKKKLNC